MTALPHARELEGPVSPALDRRSRELENTESLAERYTRLAGTQFAPRAVDHAMRTLDFLIASLALLVAGPLAVLIAVVVALTSGRPVLYGGPRVGRAGEIFTMFKFRTLARDAEARLGPYLGEELSRRTEAELTPVGRLLRASHLDELPQLFNVLRGDMAVVGPRPIRPAFFEQLCLEIPQYWQRLVVRPGITGFAQLRLTRDMSWAEKLAHDLEYIADRSARLYLRVCVATAVRVLRGLGTGLREHVARAG